VDQAAASGTGIDQVHFYLDGSTAIAALPYGSARPDVASYLGSARFTNSGYSYSWNIASLPRGPHTIDIYAHSVVSGWQYITRAVTIAPPLIALDAPAYGSTAQGSVNIAGWAVDRMAASGTGIDQVHLYMDAPGGSVAFVAGMAYGDPRSDVAAYLGSSQFTNSGYHFHWDLGGIGAGNHTMYVYVHSVLAGWFVVSRPFTVLQSYPQIALDSPQPGASVQGSSVTVSGWAVDQAAASGTGIDQVHLYLDGPAGVGSFVAGLPYGSARPDVASYLGSARFTNSGYSYQWNIAGLAKGSHQLVIYAHSVVSGWTYVTRTITVQ